MRAERRAALPDAPGLAGMAGVPVATGAASQGFWIAAGLSVAVHLGLAGWAASSGLFRHEADAPPAGLTAVVMSGAAFEALRSKPPAVETTAPAQLMRPEAMDASPVPMAADDGAFATLPPGLTVIEAVPETAPDIDQTAPVVKAAAPAPEPTPQVADPQPETVAEPEPERKPDQVDTAEETAPRPTEAVQSRTSKQAKADRKAAGGKGEERLMSDWGGRIRSRIDRAKSYPRAERALGVTGTVTLKLTVSRSGQVTGVSVAGGSGSDELDRAAVAAVKRAGRLPKAPDGLGRDSYSFSLPVTFAR